MSFLCFVLCLFNYVNAQSSKISKISNFIETYSFPVTNSDGDCIVKYNTEVGALTIDGYRMILSRTNVNISNSEGYYLVNFECISGNNCIKDPNGILRYNFAIPFGDRSKCVEFINLINSL